jgi:hypothetical protein
MMRTSLDEIEIYIKPGIGIISVSISPLQLRGGTYFVQAMIRDASDAKSMVTSNSDWFYVSGSTLTFNEMNGVFEPNRNWIHRHSSAPSNELKDAKKSITDAPASG